jgi:cystathionine beta-lyase/cystathionine gamma-synthase
VIGATNALETEALKDVTDFDPYTLAARFGAGESDARPVAPPLYQTSTFWSPDPDEFLEMATKPRHTGFYTRYGNPTVRLFEDAVAQLEGAEAAMAFASGMGATTGAVLSLAAGALGLLAAWGGVRVLAAAPGYLPYQDTLTIDAPVLWFTLGAAVPC